MQFYDLYNEGRDIDSVLKDLVGIALTSDENNKVVGFQPKGSNRIGHFNLTNGGGGGTVDADEDEIILGNGIGEAPKGAEVFLKKYEFPQGFSEDEVYLNFYFSAQMPPSSITCNFNFTLIDSSNNGTNLFDFLSTDYTAATSMIINGQEINRQYSSYIYAFDGQHSISLNLLSKRINYSYSYNEDRDFYTFSFVLTLKISRSEAENLLNFSKINVAIAGYPTTLAISVGNIFIIKPRLFYPSSPMTVDIIKENTGCTITDSQEISDILYYNSGNSLSPTLNLQANSILSVGKLSKGLIGIQSFFQVDDHSLFEIKERSRFSQYGNSRVKIGSYSKGDTRLIIQNGAKVDIIGTPNCKAPEVFIRNNTEINIDSGQNLTGEYIDIPIKEFPRPLKANEDYGSKIRIHDSAKVEMDHEAYLQMHDTSSIVMTSSADILMHDASLVSLNGDAFIQMDGKIGRSPTLDLSGGCNIIGNGSIKIGNTIKELSEGPTFLMNPNSFYIHTSNKSGPQNGESTDLIKTDFINALKRVYQKTEESELHLIYKSDLYGYNLYTSMLINMCFNLSNQAHQFRDFSIETKQALLSKIKELINNGDTTIDDVNEYLESKRFYAYIFQNGLFRRIKNFNFLRTYSETEESLRALIFSPSMYDPLYTFIQTIDPTYTLEIEIIGRYYRNASDVDQYDYYPIAAALDDLDMTTLPSTCYLGSYVIMEEDFFKKYYADYIHLFFSSVDETGHLDPEGQYWALKNYNLKRNTTEVDGKIVGVSFRDSFLQMIAGIILEHPPACYYQEGLSTVIIGGNTVRDGDGNNPNIYIDTLTIPGDTYVRIGANAGRKVETYILNNSRVEVNDDSVIYVNGNVNDKMVSISTPKNGSVLQLFNNSYFAMLGYDTINNSNKMEKIVPYVEPIGSPIFLMTGISKLSLDKTARLVLSNGSGIESTMDETTHTVSYDFSFGFNSEDKVTITKEDFEKLSTIPNFWFGTEAEYDALGTYDPHTIYMIEEG